MDEGGQASVEAIGALPMLVATGLVSLQLLAAGYSLTLADGAAEAAALARAAGRSAPEAALTALPGWARDRVRVSVSDRAVRIRLSPPSPFGALADALTVTSTAAVRRPRR